MINKTLLAITLLICLTTLHAQHLPVNLRLTAVTGYNGPEIPFWMRSNQFGSVPPAGFSAGLIGSAYKNYSTTPPKKFDWGFGTEVRLNAGGASSSSTTETQPSWFSLIQGYAKIRYGIFELKAGRTKDITGLCDTLLSSGSWAVSGNSLGIPKIQLSIPEFFTIPWFGGMFAFKGNYAHGWIGTKTYLLQQSLYGRFGKGDWKLKLYGGFNHQAVWGDERNRPYGEDYELNGLETFIYVNLGKAYNNGIIKTTRVGNHLGSIDLALSYDFSDIRVFIYRQFIYDAGALYYLANLRDGLNGISITKRNTENRLIKWNKIVIEFLYTKNQAGEVWSPYTTSIDENYYNNGYYSNGWSYMGTGIGNPFISDPSYINDELPTASGQYFPNNRVAAIHSGFDLDLFDWNVLCKFSFSRNYGHYLTSKTGKMYEGGINQDEVNGIFPKTDQFSGYLTSYKDLKRGIHIGYTLAADKGGLYKNGFGIMAFVGKRW